ncbi:MAG: PhoPQ-activated pathogenicity-related family protein [Saprospiraceae bacterium]|nr:PhoPQ-activated pathogenicity-related family protein [Saprospiraceae bacterium]
MSALPRRLHLFLSLLFIFLIASCTSTDSLTKRTAVDERMSLMKEYVYSDDGMYAYSIEDELKGQGFTTIVVKLTSQKWLTTAEVKDPIWWHWLTLVVPDNYAAETAMIVVGGGSRTRAQPNGPDEIAAQLAMGTNSIVAALHNIPNQPIEFVGDDYGPRKEDELIAYGWRQYLEGGAQIEDAKWMARFPMTKAVVKAMDAIQDLTASRSTMQDVKSFVITGGSKRGWTTWTTGIVDDRVVAIAPIVIDMLNMVPSFEHHWQAYGFWAPAVGNYVEEGIMEWQNTVEYAKLNQLTEPYQFRDQLKLPKLILNATGDQFFLPDSWKFYWDDLVGEKHLRYVPNTEHSMDGSDVLETLGSFYQFVLAGQERPRFDWSVKEGALHIQTDPKFPPASLTLWQAHNPKERDFRTTTIGKAYESSSIDVRSDGQYQVTVDAPDMGYTAYFVELSFPGLGPYPLKLTTGVMVTPDKYDHAPYSSPMQKGTPLKK